MTDLASRSSLDSAAGLKTSPDLEHSVRICHHYDVECRAADGSLRWRDSFDNLVTTAGRNKYLDATLKTGLASPTWFVGLVVGPGGSNTYAAADTMASHAGWTEFTNYSEGTRQALVTGTIAAGSVDNSASRASFSINGGGGNVGGAFLADNSTKSGTTGVCLGVGNFTSGDRAVINGDTVLVTLTATIT